MARRRNPSEGFGLIRRVAPRGRPALDNKLNYIKRKMRLSPLKGFPELRFDVRWEHYIAMLWRWLMPDATPPTLDRCATLRLGYKGRGGTVRHRLTAVECFEAALGQDLKHHELEPMVIWLWREMNREWIADGESPVRRMIASRDVLAGWVASKPKRVVTDPNTEAVTGLRLIDLMTLTWEQALALASPWYASQQTEAYFKTTLANPDGSMWKLMALPYPPADSDDEILAPFRAIGKELGHCYKDWDAPYTYRYATFYRIFVLFYGDRPKVTAAFPLQEGICGERDEGDCDDDYDDDYDDDEYIELTTEILGTQNQPPTAQYVPNVERLMAFLDRHGTGHLR